MLRTWRFIIALAIAFLLQTVLVHRFTYDFLRPDLLYLTAIYVALESDYRSALWCALAAGLLRDLGSTGRLGAGPLLLVPACAGLVFLKEYLVRDRPWTDLALTFACVLACGTVTALLTAAFVSGPQLAELLRRAAGQAAYSALLAPLVFVALHKAGIVDPAARPFLT